MIPLYKTPSNSPTSEVHPGERRGAQRKILIEILTKILILFIYIPSSLRQSTSISLYLKSFYKMQAASYSTLQAQNRERHIETSRDTLLDTLLLPPHQSCITISLLCRTNCGQYLVVSYSILLCLTSTKPDTSS